MKIILYIMAGILQSVCALWAYWFVLQNSAFGGFEGLGELWHSLGSYDVVLLVFGLIGLGNALIIIEIMLIGAAMMIFEFTTSGRKTK